MKTVPGGFLVWQGVIAAAVAGGLALSFTGWQWDLVKSRIRRAHPDLMQLPTRDLASWLENPRATRPVILDVRTRAEFDVSHLPGALHVEPEARLTDLGLPPAKEAPLVLYCSVGTRSAEFGARLHAAGYIRVYQLDGSIFKWANEDRVLAAERGVPLTVHPQNKSWEHLLKKERRAADVAPVP